MIRICFDRQNLSSREHNVYAEPFIEFMTQGQVTPVVPQIYPGMSVSRILRAVDVRDKLFADGLAGPVKALAERFEAYYPQIRDASLGTIRAYHDWYAAQAS